MNPKREYRILEFDGRFSIQILIKESARKHWWSKSQVISRWVGVDGCGNPNYYSYRYMCPPFKTLAEARQRAQSWMKGITIQKVEGTMAGRTITIVDAPKL